MCFIDKWEIIQKLRWGTLTRQLSREELASLASWFMSAAEQWLFLKAMKSLSFKVFRSSRAKIFWWWFRYD